MGLNGKISQPLSEYLISIWLFYIIIASKRANVILKRVCSFVHAHRGFMQDQIVASHTCFGGHMDVTC